MTAADIDGIPSPGASRAAVPSTPFLPTEPRSLKVGWDGVVLICQKCQKRGSGPSKLKAKRIAKAVKGAGKASKRYPRIVMTGCLGPCPKRGITVAAAPSEGQSVSAWAVGSDDEADALAQRLATAPRA